MVRLSHHPGERGIDRNSMSRYPFGKRVSNPIESSCKSSLPLLCERLDQNHLFNRRFRYKIIWFRHRRVAVRIRAAVKILLKILTVLEMNCSLN